jgi:deoxyribodipyrimidine photo-lyase
VNAEVASLGGRLTIRRGELTEVLAELRRQFQRMALWAHEETGTRWTFDRDLVVHRWCKSHGVRFTEYPQFGVTRALDTRDGWSRRWAEFMYDQRVSVPESITFIAPIDSLDIDALPLQGTGQSIEFATPPGREPALACAKTFLRSRGIRYHQEMSSPLTAAESCSRLSSYLALGCISMRETVHLTQAQRRTVKAWPKHERTTWPAALSAFNGRLHWHCHFIQKLEQEPVLEEHNLSRSMDGLRESSFDRSLFEAWCRGETGYPFVDACMRSLEQTGWINFRMRAMLVSFAAYDLWLHWREPALHLARLFVDYEPGIHFSQMQMQSGTTGINTLRIYSPIKQSRDQDPDGVFIRHWVPELAALPTEYLHEPWTMPASTQARLGFRLGEHYPKPVVDHSQAV